MTCDHCGGMTRKFGKFRNKNRVVQRYRCRSCDATFSERQPLDGLTIAHEKVVQIANMLAEGVGVRACGRLAGCDPHTVLKVLVEVGRKCEALHDRLSRDIRTDAVQLDEIWSHVGVHQKMTTFSDALRGDFYTFLAVAAREKFVVSHYTGKRDVFSSDVFLADVAMRVPGRVQVSTDSFHGYTKMVPKHLAGRADFATIEKVYALPLPPRDEVYRRYRPPCCVEVRRRVRMGQPRKDRINTSFVERTNLTLRHFNKRFVRLGLGWSKKLENHRLSLSLFVCAYNFCKVHSTLGCTPAMAVGIAGEPWTVKRLVDEAASIGNHLNTGATNG